MTATLGDLSVRVIPPPLPARTVVGQRWIDLPLRRKLASVVVLVAIVCLPPAGLALALDDRLSDARRDSQQTDDALDTLTALQDTALIRGGGAVESYVIEGSTDAAHVEDYRAASAAVPALLADLTDAVPDDLDAPLTEVLAAYETLIPSLDAVVALDEFAAEEVSAATAATAAAFAANGRLGEALDDRVAAQRDRVARLQGLLVQATLASLVLTLLTAVGGTYLVTGGIVRRIERLSRSAERFVRNEVVLPSIRSRDEVGRLDASLSAAATLLDTRRNEAIAATRAKDEFLSRVSHELKTPLTAMVGFGQLIGEDEAGSYEHGHATGIVDAGQQLHELIEELLDIRAIEAGKLELHREPVAVHQQLDEAVALVRPLADARSVTITVRCAPQVAVFADARRLREVLRHVLADAVEHDRVDGRVDVVAEDLATGTVRVQVTDSGIGTTESGVPSPPPDRAEAGADGLGGTGIGLALARNMVEAMGGTVGGDAAPQRGSTFWFELPVPGAEPPHPDEGPVRPSGTGSIVGAAPRVLPPSAPARTRAGRWWMDLSLHRKVLSIVCLITVVCLPPIAVGLVLDTRLDDAQRETERTTEAAVSLDELQESLLLRGHEAVQSYVIGGLSDDDAAERYRAEAAALPDRSAELEEVVPRDLSGPLTAVLASATTLVERLDAVLAEGAESGADASLVDDMISANSATAASFEANGRLAAALDERIAAQRRAIDRLQEQLVWAMAASLLLALGAAVAGTYAVTTGIVRRIEQLSDNAARFAADRPVLAVVRSRDEIGQLNRTMAFAGELLDARRNEARAATRAKDEFLSRVSHELKAPLAAMLDLAQLITTDPAIPEQSRDDAAHIVSAGHHLHELIEELLDIKAIEAGQLSLAVEPVDLATIVDEAVCLVRPRADRRSLTISVDTVPTAVLADRRRLREILLNLLSNAVKYNRDGGSIAVAAERRADRTVRVSVSDSGPGIAPGDLPRLFTPFERLAASTTDIEGTGIGLALTKNVVEAMGGSIGVDSEVGQGTTFWFELPAADADPHPGDDDLARRSATTR